MDGPDFKNTLIHEPEEEYKRLSKLAFDSRGPEFNETWSDECKICGFPFYLHQGNDASCPRNNKPGNNRPIRVFQGAI